MGLQIIVLRSLNDITFIPNFMKIYQAVQKLVVEDTQRDRLVSW
jgi:hypothetical protein